MIVCTCELYVYRVLRTIVQLYVYLCEVRGTPKRTVKYKLQKTICTDIRQLSERTTNEQISVMNTFPNESFELHLLCRRAFLFLFYLMNRLYFAFAFEKTLSKDPLDSTQNYCEACKKTIVHVKMCSLFVCFVHHYCTVCLLAVFDHT